MAGHNRFGPALRGTLQAALAAINGSAAITGSVAVTAPAAIITAAAALATALVPAPAAAISTPEACPPAGLQQPLAAEGGIWLRPAGAAAAPLGQDYRQQLATTAYGWPRLDAWCVWIEPLGHDPASRLWEERWQAAVQQALAEWQRQLVIIRVDDPSQAQVRLWRRRPPLIPGPDGRLRASHGRATLQLLRITRQGSQRLEPAVEVLISPAQRQAAIQATALHELGHALGIWGHSEDPNDAMAAVPGPQPVLQLSARDLATLRWLYGQPTRFGVPLPPSELRRSAAPAGQ